MFVPHRPRLKDTDMTNTTVTKEKPIHEIRIGGIKAALWKNEYVRGIIRYNVTFSRVYREENQWKTTTSFGRDDLLVLGKVADRAHSWICAQLQPESNGVIIVPGKNADPKPQE